MLSLVTFANLGKKKNLKTSDVVPVISTFETHSELAQVVCQINAGSRFPNTISALPAAVRFALGMMRRVGISVSRARIEELFDFFAASRVINADVTILHGGYFLTRTAQAAKKKGSIVVDLAVSAHIATNAALEKEELPTLGYPEFEGLYTHLVKEHRQAADFQYVIALSEFVKDSYVAQGFSAGRIFVASPDIDLTRFTLKAHSEEHPFKLLYVAHTQPLKGLHYVLDAWESLTLKDAELHIVGGFSDMPRSLEESYRARMNDLPGVRWIAATDSPEQYYATASALVFPSLTEGFGRVTLEAMASGIPVITTEHARGIVEDGKTGFVVPIRDAAALAAKIQYLYDYQDVARDMGVAARKAVEAKQSFGEQVYAIYMDILAREKKI